MTTTSRLITKLIIHCSATAEGRDYTAAQVSQWHQARNFSPYTDPLTGASMYVGYHYLIHLDGTIESCRPEGVVGCHTRGHNNNSIGICYIGGLGADGRPKDTRTPAQKSALKGLLGELRVRYPAVSIHGHNEFAAKACPCFDVRMLGC